MGALTKDVAGQRFGMLVAVDLVGGFGPRGAQRWRCRCDCGGEVFVRGYELRVGDKGSCGCARRTGDLTAANGSAGRTRSPERRSWTDMIQRCTNPKRSKFAIYGGRGISVCAQWRESFDAFLADVGPRPGRGFSLDRIDVNGNYEPGNVRWSSNTEQSRNRRTNTVIVHDGKSLTVQEWAERHGVKYQTAWARLRKGASFDEAFSTAHIKRRHAPSPV